MCVGHLAQGITDDKKLVKWDTSDKLYFYASIAPWRLCVE